MPVMLTRKQYEAAKLLGGDAPNIMLFGGSRSGKTFLISWRMIHNAISCPGSRQAIFRKHFNTVRTAVGQDTLPKVMKLEHVYHRFRFDARDSVFRCDNGSEIWLLGLDDKERVDKVLGKEFCVVYFNECSEVSWHAVQTAMTRVAQKVVDIFGKPRRARMFFDENPPSKSHWSYKVFILKLDPVTRLPWKRPERWTSMRLNPSDNMANINEAYKNILGEFTGKSKQRFVDGVFTDDTENALWKRETMIDANRLLNMPSDMDRIVVGVDPAVTDKESSCATGIVVAGKKKIGITEHFYILDDRTFRGSPDQWAKQTVKAFDKFRADRVVAETNNGGALVESLLRTVRRNLPITQVYASRGKIKRAEPVAALYEQNRVHHVGDLSTLEDQMCNYTGPGCDIESDALDAAVWAITDLMNGGIGTIHQTQNII